MANIVPNVLYKYRSCNARSLEMLRKNEVYFASPKDFNDPFDCSAQKSMHDNFREDMAKVSASLQLKVPFELLTNEQVQPFRNMINNYDEMIQSRVEIQQALSEMDKLGILSLSERNDSILMWSHYADSHKGFCIGYVNYFDGDASAIEPVIYSEARNPNFLFNFFSGSSATEDEFGEELKKEWFLTKYIDWKYEEEWRIIALAGYVGTYSNSCLDRIIFGLNMPQVDRNKIRTVLTGRDVKYFEAVKSVDNFAIEIREIEG